MEHIKDILPRVHKDLMDKVEQQAYEKMIEYIQDIGDYYEDPAEKQAANEVYDSYMSDLENYGVTNNTVYVIYTNEGPYDTAHSEEAAYELAQTYGLCPGTYKVVKEQLSNLD